MSTAIAKDLSKNPELTIEVPCQFGIMDTTKDYLAEFTRQGTIEVQKHPFLPQLFWEYKIFDEKKQLMFSSIGNTKKVGLDDAVDDYWCDGNRGRIDCLISANSADIPVGTTLSCERYLGSPNTYQLRFRRKIEDTEMTWIRQTTEDKEQDYFEIQFGNRSQDSVHLRLLTTEEKQFFKNFYTFGLFLSSNFYYPYGNGKSILLRTLVSYPMNSLRALGKPEVYSSKAKDMTLGNESWRRFDCFRQRSDIYLDYQILDREPSGSHSNSKPIPEVIKEVSEGTPDTLRWEVFQSLFSLHKMGTFAWALYGEYGALKIKKK